ncbi:Rik1-associated factor 1 [Tolypocladium ophioglossoides CBS 100239]|uniref:Rik1-associated factor 1 n=1 Tax=Tolypocladium ophioglossoides (strain CBS 100239) TaxID=1163406 RepID=A0A0L0NJX4_TOLOC|nr:Rik1-associated factor 1 [Tolypocladium ophioglossoides CBS 100239]
MSITLTTTLPRAVIDLTNDGPPAPQPFAPSQAKAHKALPNAPPAKRRRVEDDALYRVWRLKTCVQLEILPLVSSAVNRFPRAQYRVDDIAVQAITSISSNPTFRTRAEESNGQLLPQHRAEAKGYLVEIVEKLAALPQYQIRPLKPSVEEAAVPLRTLPQASNDTEPTSCPPQPNATSRVLSTTKPGFRARYTQRHTARPRAHATDPPATANRWLGLEHRPYLPAAERDSIAKGAKCPIPAQLGAIKWPLVYHVDFTSDEVAEVLKHMAEYLPASVPYKPAECLTGLCFDHNVATIVGDALRGRSAEDLRNFCSDLMAGLAASPDKIRVLSLDQDVRDQRSEDRRSGRVPSLLLARELEGNARFGRTRQLENFQNEFKKAHEDGLTVIAEFTNCAGDISAMSWVPDGNVLCGTTAHSDTHNQQYNKPGNMLLCSTSRGTLRAFADHRIPRPLVEEGENSTEAMRQSQDPWLYSSVVSSYYDKAHGRAYTSSFDKTVKVWNVAKDGDSMEAVATWHHGGNVNFVAAGKDGSGRVASAADVPTKAVRVYTVNTDNAAESTYQAISCTRTDADDSDKWAYFPATMHWGRAPGTTHLLVVGYSPRSLTNDDRDIPEDKRNSGEIMMWDASRGCRVPVLTATTANVFEVVWHPNLPRFAVATTPSGLTIEHGIRTQIHLFQRDREREDGAYSEFQKLDCPAADINEIALMPNSLRHAYVTAGCTDGKVYVWDTAQGDHPIHVLEHGYPLDDFAHDREKEDTGVKFTAWGTTADRLYTGSSDGVVKVWNVRNRHQPFVRNLLEAPGPISCGIFSPDHAKLAVGDATGRVFLCSVDKRDENEAHFTTLPGTNRRIRRPKPFIPHPEPPPPEQDPDRMDVDPPEHSIGAYARETYIASGQLVLNRNPVVGAVQGPKYASTGLFLREAHLDEDPTSPLLTEYERNQRESLDMSRGIRRRSQRRLKNPFADGAALLDKHGRDKQHAFNKSRDIDYLKWDFPELWTLLVRDGATLTDVEEDWGFTYEELPVCLEDTGEREESARGDD